MGAHGHDEPGGVALPAAARANLEQRLARGAFDLPLLPDVATQVLALVHAPGADAARLSAVLHRDAALAGHVLRVANSPLFMPRTQIVSLQQAVSRLGMRTLSEIVVTVSVQERVFRSARHQGLLRAEWRHSLAAAFFARELARLRRRNVEGAYLGGLLHDVGRPIALSLLSEAEQEGGVAFTPGQLEDGMQTFHVRLGTTLAERWGLPALVQAAIRWHHEPELAGEWSEVAMLACLADELAQALVGVEDPAQIARIRQHPALDVLNVYPDEMEQLVQSRAQLAAVLELSA
ncbi:MAG: HDOD domain-containing protein [Planctomycetes bacterium]|nr:HDOD domain-containing protein [Planctomycetota bacterium]